MLGIDNVGLDFAELDLIIRLVRDHHHKVGLPSLSGFVIVDPIITQLRYCVFLNALSVCFL